MFKRTCLSLSLSVWNAGPSRRLNSMPQPSWLVYAKQICCARSVRPRNKAGKRKIGCPFYIDIHVVIYVRPTEYIYVHRDHLNKNSWYPSPPANETTWKDPFWSLATAIGWDDELLDKRRRRNEWRDLFPCRLVTLEMYVSLWCETPSSLKSNEKKT